MKAFNCPGHGTSFGRQHNSEGYLQSKDLQKDLFSIFCLPIGMRRKWRLPDRKAILLRVFVSAHRKSLSFRIGLKAR
jgi:hypothetical protein